MNLVMISGDTDLAQGKKGAFYYMLEEFSQYWDRIDIVCPRTEKKVKKVFDNVYIHVSDTSKLCQWKFITNKIIELHKTIHFDVMTVQAYPPFYNSLGALRVKKKTNIPYLFEMHHITGYPKAGSKKELLYKYFSMCALKFLTKRASAVRVVNKEQVANFLIKYGVQKNKITYIPSFYIDHSVFTKKEVTKKYDLMFAARLEKNKGILNLLKAIRILKNNNQDVSLVIVGNGSLKNTIKKYVVRHNLENNVFLSGWLDTINDVAHVYNESRVFINPSYNEGGPRVLLEAAACGLPLISTPVGIATDLINDGVNGWYISWDPKHIAKKITHVLQDEHKLEMCSKESLSMSKQFDRKKSIKNYAESLKKLVP